MPDLNTRIAYRRQEDDQTRRTILEATSKIYKEGYAVKGTAVEDILKGDSLLPIEVQLHAHPKPIR